MPSAKLDLMPETAPSLRSHIRVAGHSLRPLAAGALYWEAEDTLLVADLHLEKGAAFAALGMLLPPYDTRTTRARLAKVTHAVEPLRVVALGDSFHRSHCAERLAAEDDVATRPTPHAPEGLVAAHAGEPGGWRGLVYHRTYEGKGAPARMLEEMERMQADMLATAIVGWTAFAIALSAPDPFSPPRLATRSMRDRYTKSCATVPAGSISPSRRAPISS